MIGEAEQKLLLPVLDDLSSAVEDIVSTGLTTASKATIDKLDVSFKEASRLKLGRLAASLRYTTDEIGRYVQHSPDFQPKRLSMFLNRSWVLAQGLSHAIRANDTPMLERLLWAPTPVPLKSVDVVVIGVHKRVARTTGSFDFRLRDVATGRPLIWSFLFNRKDVSIPAEAWLHLPQPQKFNPKILLDGRVMTIADAALAPDDRGGGRVLLGPKSTVVAGNPFDDWARFAVWDKAAALERVKKHAPGPLDLEVELQEEVVLANWTVGAAIDRGRPEQVTLPVVAGSLVFDANVSTGDEGREVRSAIDAMRTATSRPPLFGVVHYELCRLVLQPLAFLEAAKPRYIMVSDATIDVRALMKTLTF